MSTQSAKKKIRKVYSCPLDTKTYFRAKTARPTLLVLTRGPDRNAPTPAAHSLHLRATTESDANKVLVGNTGATKSTTLVTARYQTKPHEQVLHRPQEPNLRFFGSHSSLLSNG